MEIVENKALLLKLRDPQRIVNIIPKSGIAPDGRVAVYWGLEEVQVLRNLGIDAPSPIDRDYAWPGMYRPFAHQRTTAAFLTMNRRAHCFNEQGTGKTASAIWAADYLMSIGEIRRVLVICPLSIMDSAWRDDLFNFAMHRSADVAYGAAEKRRKIIQGNSEFVIINYDGLLIVEKEIAAANFDLIIVDEATHYKNPQTDRWKVLSRILTTDKWLWMMTGTPAAQSPVDAFGLAKLVSPDRVPKFYGAFRDKVMYKVTNFKWAPKADANDTVHEALQPAIRFTKEECLDLPDIVYTKRVVAMTPQQNKYYKELKNKMRTVAAGEEVSAANAAVNMNKLLQIAAGAVYTDTGEALEFDISSRYKVLREVIDESNRKVLVFVPFKHAINLLATRLREDKITTEVIQGDVPAATRTAIFKAFQTEDNPRVLVIQPQAAAHGVTLTAADTIVWWGPVPSLETYLQANARIHRAGQTHKCTVIQLQGAPVEQHIYSMLDNRIDVHTRMIDLYKQIVD